MRLSEISLFDADELAVIDLGHDTCEALDLAHDVLAFFAEQVRTCPQLPACLHEDGAVSYEVLDVRANRIAHYLRGQGVGPNELVGLLFERSADFLASVLGVWKAGGAYLPLDPQYPAAYLEQILRDAAPRCVLTHGTLADELGLTALRLDDACISTALSTAPEVKIHPEQLAYVMYTSGSTGGPKGVMVPHRQILNWLHNLWQKVPFDNGTHEHEVVAQKTSTGFAISVKELLAGLLAGVPQVFVPEAIVRDVPAFVRRLEQWHVTRLYTFPTQLQALLDEARASGTSLSSLRQLFISIEPCPVELIEQLRAQLPQATPWYIYGCTEINDITYCEPAEQLSASGFVPIGRPIRHTRVHVLDEEMRPVPLGVMGELWVDSLGLARGYLARPGLTAQRFVANPWGLPGARLYCTGDMARTLPGGALEFLGRRDHEVKIRGYRVDLRQVEKVIASHPGVHEAAVVGWPPGSHGAQLVAYVVGEVAQSDALQVLRQRLTTQLPTYMVPALLQPLAALPRLPNGKLDALSLPEPQFADASTAYVEPATPTQRALAAMWSQVLQQANQSAPRVGAADNFFNLGGHSLLAAQLFSRIRQEFNVELPISTLFESPVLSAFAKAVDTALQSLGGNAGSRITPVDRNGPLPLSYLQERLWFVHEHMPEQRTSYNGTIGLHLRGELDVQAIRASFEDLVARHETLRTTFRVVSVGSEPMQVIASPSRFELPIEPALLERVFLEMDRLAGHIYDLEHGPLFMAQLLRLAPRHHVLLIGMHHIIFDAWSLLNVMSRDLQAFYAARVAGSTAVLPPLPIQYADYATWQRTQDLSAHRAYWQDRLAGYADGLELPYDFPRPATRTWRAATYIYRYPAELARSFAGFTQAHRASLFMGLVASLAVVLGRYSGREDLCLGTTTGARGQLELEDVMGFFINILALRIDLSGDPDVDELMSRVQRTVLEALEYQALPFEHVLNALQRQRDSSQIPLVPVILRHQNFPTAVRRAWSDDLDMEVIARDERTTPTEIDLQFFGDGTSLEVTVEYAEALFTPATIERLIDHHRKVLELMVRTSSQTAEVT